MKEDKFLFKLEVCGLNSETVFFHSGEGKIGLDFYLMKKLIVRKNSVLYIAFSVCINPDVWEILSSCNQIEVELCIANGTSLSFMYRGCKKCLWELHWKVTYEMNLKSHTHFFFLLLSASGWTGNLWSWTIPFSLIFIVGYILNLATVIFKCWILLH